MELSPDDRTPPATLSLGGGVRAPYPVPTSASASAVGSGNRSTNTSPEIRLRRELHRRGLRYRTNLPVRAGSVRVKIDIAFTARRLAIFVDGCFWHSCPEHGRTPRSNVDYWSKKLARNAERDARVDEALEADGWRVIRVWEHENVQLAGVTIEAAARHRSGS